MHAIIVLSRRSSRNIQFKRVAVRQDSCQNVGIFQRVREPVKKGQVAQIESCQVERVINVMHVGFISMTHQELLSALSVEGGGPSTFLPADRAPAPLCRRIAAGITDQKREKICEMAELRNSTEFSSEIPMEFTTTTTVPWSSCAGVR